MNDTAPETGPRIEATSADGIGRIVLNNPRRMNAMAPSMWRAISETLARFASDDAVRCVVFSGAGEKAFCSGVDTSEFGEDEDDPRIVIAQDAEVHRILAEIHAFPKPTIARIHGYCVGAGVAIASSCDLRIAEPEATFGIPAARFGLGTGVDLLRRMTAQMGAAPVKMMMFTGRRFPAADALQFGLVDRVVEPAALDTAVEDLARTVAGNAPLTMAAAKAAILLPPDAPEAEVAAVRARTTACFRSADFAEGRRAFREKRPPAFTGR